MNFTKSTVSVAVSGASKEAFALNEANGFIKTFAGASEAASLEFLGTSFAWKALAAMTRGDIAHAVSLMAVTIEASEMFAGSDAPVMAAQDKPVDMWLKAIGDYEAATGATVDRAAFETALSMARRLEVEYTPELAATVWPTLAYWARKQLGHHGIMAAMFEQGRDMARESAYGSGFNAGRVCHTSIVYNLAGLVDTAVANATAAMDGTPFYEVLAEERYRTSMLFTIVGSSAWAIKAGRAVPAETQEQAKHIGVTMEDVARVAAFFYTVKEVQAPDQAYVLKGMMELLGVDLGKGFAVQDAFDLAAKAIWGNPENIYKALCVDAPAEGRHYRFNPLESWGNNERARERFDMIEDVRLAEVAAKWGEKRAIARVKGAQRAAASMEAMAGRIEAKIDALSVVKERWAGSGKALTLEQQACWTLYSAATKTMLAMDAEEYMAPIAGRLDRAPLYIEQAQSRAKDRTARRALAQVALEAAREYDLAGYADGYVEDIDCGTVADPLRQAAGIMNRRLEAVDSTTNDAKKAAAVAELEASWALSDAEYRIKIAARRAAQVAQKATGGAV